MTQLVIFICLILFISNFKVAQTQSQQPPQCFSQGGLCNGQCYINCLPTSQNLPNYIQECLYNQSTLSLDLTSYSNISISLLVDDSTQVYIQPLLVTNGSVINSASYASVSDSQFYFQDLNELSITGMIFSHLSSVTNNMISIQNCRNITIQNCNFNNIQFAKTSNGQSTISNAIKIIQTNILYSSQKSQIDTILIQNIKYYRNIFNNIGSFLYVSKLSQNQLIIQNNSISSNIQYSSGVFNISKVLCKEIFIEDNFMFNNTIKSGSGGLVDLISPASTIYFLQNTYSSNVAVSGNAPCHYISGSSSSIYFTAEVYEYNSGSLQSADTGIIFTLFTSGPIYFTECLFNSNSMYFGGIYIYYNLASVQINNCNFTSNIAQWGGALNIQGAQANINIQQCLFQNNQASAFGGAITMGQMQYNQVYFINSQFISNQASIQGGTIYITNCFSNIIFQNCQHTNNQAPQGGSIDIETYTGNIQLLSNLFTQNTATYGGILYIYQSQIYDFELSNCTLNQNSAQNSGGAIYMYQSDGEYILEDSQFMQNSALVQGGIVYTYQGSGNFMVQNNIFQDNYCNQEGGAFYTEQSQYLTNLSSNYYLNNTALQDGGVYYFHQSQLEIFFYNETFEQNIALQLGGGVKIQNPTGNINIQNSSFYGNQGLNGGSIYLDIPQSSISLISNIFDKNTAEISGAALYINICAGEINLSQNNFTNNSAQSEGGCIYIVGLQQGFTMDQSYFANNSASYTGGALTLYSVLNQMSITNSTFIQNSASVGGAINVQQVSYTILISNCYFTNNNANQYGGVMSIVGKQNTQNSATISNSNFMQNSAINQAGGDVFCQFLHSLNFQNNIHKNSQAQAGGSLYVINIDNLMQNDLIFTQCISQVQGGAIFAKEIVNFNSTNTTFNSCTTYQGTVYIIQSTNLQIVDIIMSQNIAQDSGAAFYLNQINTTQIQNIQMVNNYASNNGGGLVISDNLELNINNIQCLNNNAQSGCGGCLYIQDNQYVSFTGKQLYQNNYAGQLGGGVYIKNSVSENLLVYKLNFSFNQASAGGALAIQDSGYMLLNLTESQFSSNQALLQGGALYFQSQLNNQSVDQIILNAAEPTANNHSNLSQIFLINNNFSNNMAQQGGAAAILQTSFAIINNTSFEQNQAISNLVATVSEVSSTSNGGGALYLQDTQYTCITNSIFARNIGFKGGAFYQTTTQIASNITKNVSVYNSLFLANQATQEGGAISIEYSQNAIEIKNCNFSSNQALIAGAIIISIQQIYLQQQLRNLQTNLASDYQTKLIIAGNNFQNNSVTNNAQYAEVFRVVCNESLNLADQQYIELYIESANMIQPQQSQNSISSGCQPGEAHDITTNECSPCTLGLYSQGGYGSQCVICPTSSYCPGDYGLIWVEAGFWRANSSSLIIIQCIHTQAQCLGGEFCQYGYTGILCEQCDEQEGYTRGEQPYTCDKCTKDARVQIVAILSILFTVGMVLIVVYGNINFRYNELRTLFTQKVCNFIIIFKNNVPSFTRTLINHAQILTIFFTLDIKYPNSLVSFFSFFGQFTEVASHQIMCQFGIISNLHPAYVKVIYNHVAAVISLAVLAIVLGLLHWKKILIFKEQMKSITINLLVYLMPGMINQLAALLSQRKVDDISNESFTIYELSLVWDSEEFQYSYKLVLPLLCFWLGLFGWVAYVILRYGKTFFHRKQDASLVKEVNRDSVIKNSHSISKSSIFVFNYGNFFIGYNEERYYWEAIMMGVKLVLIIIQNVFSYSPMIVTSFSLLVLVIVLAVQLQYNPYHNLSVRQLANMCLIAQLVTLLMLQIMYIEPNSPGLFYFSFVTMVLLNYIIMLFLVKNICHDTLQYLFKKLQQYLLEQSDLKMENLNKFQYYLYKLFSKKLNDKYHKILLANCAWQVTLKATKLMIRKFRKHVKPSKDSVIKDTSQLEINQSSDKNQHLFKIENLKKDLLLKIAYQDWKNNQTFTLDKYQYQKWIKLRGLAPQGQENDYKQNELIVEMNKFDQEQIQNEHLNRNKIDQQDNSNIIKDFSQLQNKNILQNSQFSLNMPREEDMSPIELIGQSQIQDKSAYIARKLIESSDIAKSQELRDDESNNQSARTPMTSTYMNLFLNRSKNYKI